LGFFDTRSLRQAHAYGNIRRKAVELAIRGKKNVVIDEISMVSAEQLELIHAGFEQAAESREQRELPATGLILSGDACQLAPVPDNPKEPIKYFFEAECWPKFEA